MNKPTKEWEEKFVDLMDQTWIDGGHTYDSDGVFLNSDEAVERIKSFISQELEAQRREITNRLNTSYGADGKPALVIIESLDGSVEQRPALEEVINLINKHE